MYKKYTMRLLKNTVRRDTVMYNKVKGMSRLHHFQWSNKTQHWIAKCGVIPCTFMESTIKCLRCKDKNKI